MAGYYKQIYAYCLVHRDNNFGTHGTADVDRLHDLRKWRSAVRLQENHLVTSILQQLFQSAFQCGQRDLLIVEREFRARLLLMLAAKAPGVIGSASTNTLPSSVTATTNESSLSVSGIGGAALVTASSTWIPTLGTWALAHRDQPTMARTMPSTASKNQSTRVWRSEE
jgi:hypothetical protein